MCRTHQRLFPPTRNTQSPSEVRKYPTLKKKKKTQTPAKLSQTYLRRVESKAGETSTMAMEVTGTPGACHSNMAWTKPTEQAKGLLPQEKGDTTWDLGGPSPSLRDTRLLCGLGTPPGGHGATFPSGSRFPPQAASQSCPEERDEPL